MTGSNIPADDQPIAALSSARGASGVAIVRLSGINTHSLLYPLIKFKNPRKLENISFSKLYLCDLVDTLSDESRHEIIDEPMVVFFKGPRSYTGEDSAELHLHGGPYIVERTLRLLYKAGFRAAEAGEYTRRAFLNGKMDLTTAEGIKELASASSKQQWMAARSLATGTLANKIENLRDTLMGAMAWLEARIDFPDEGETSEIELREVEQRVGEVKKALTALEETFDSGRVATSGLKVALFGEPNAGKSTLMNKILGENRAIVTEIAGTTRDYLEEPCLINGRLIRLIDTAGVRSDDGIDKVEKIGIERSFEIAKESDIVLYLCPSDSKTPESVNQWIKEVGTTDFIKLATKSDLAKDSTPKWLDKDYLQISCEKDVGIDALNKIICDKVDDLLGKIKDDVFITSARHKEAISNAHAFIDKFYEVKSDGGYEEMLAFELQEAARCLQSVIGEVASDDILGVIFSSFCVGK
jgi:tRNA modification GTPase